MVIIEQRVNNYTINVNSDVSKIESSIKKLEHQVVQTEQNDQKLQANFYSSFEQKWITHFGSPIVVTLKFVSLNLGSVIILILCVLAFRKVTKCIKLKKAQKHIEHV